MAHVTAVKVNVHATRKRNDGNYGSDEVGASASLEATVSPEDDVGTVLSRLYAHGEAALRAEIPLAEIQADAEMTIDDDPAPEGRSEEPSEPASSPGTKTVTEPVTGTRHELGPGEALVRAWLGGIPNDEFSNVVDRVKDHGLSFEETDDGKYWVGAMNAAQAGNLGEYLRDVGEESDLEIVALGPAPEEE